MSADNWTICPNCKRIQENKTVAYGKVSEEEYLRVLREQETPLKTTLREDWEVGTDRDGEFYVSYSCRCEECGFAFEFKHEQKVPLE